MNAETRGNFLVYLADAQEYNASLSCDVISNMFAIGLNLETLKEDDNTARKYDIWLDKLRLRALRREAVALRCKKAKAL